MNAATIIPVVVQAAQLAASVSTLLGFPMGEKAAQIAPIVAQAKELIDTARATLSAADRATLDAQLAVIEPELLELSGVLQTELAVAGLVGGQR